MPKTVFNFEADANERALLRKGEYKQEHVHVVDLSAQVNGNINAIDVEANAMELEYELIIADKKITSDTAHRIYLKFNDPGNPWIPFSLIANQKSDKQSVQGTLYRVWIQVPADAVSAGAQMILHFFRGFGLGSGSGGTNTTGYGTNPGGGGGIL